jgi:hypothetical protein
MARLGPRLATIVVSLALLAGGAVIALMAGVGAGSAALEVYGSPPDCSGVVATPNSLSPATGSFELIALSGATDADGDPLTYHIDGVTQDEPVSDNTSPDAQYTSAGPNSNEVELRAERNRRKNGRVYRISFTVSDGVDGSCSGVVRVSVPRKHTHAVDDGDTASWDSFTGAHI